MCKKEMVIEDITQASIRTAHRTTEPVPVLYLLQAPKALGDAHASFPEMEVGDVYILSGNPQSMPLERKK